MSECTLRDTHRAPVLDRTPSHPAAPRRDWRGRAQCTCIWWCASAAPTELHRKRSCMTHTYGRVWDGARRSARGSVEGAPGAGGRGARGSMGGAPGAGGRGAGGSVGGAPGAGGRGAGGSVESQGPRVRGGPGCGEAPGRGRGTWGWVWGQRAEEPRAMGRFSKDVPRALNTWLSKPAHQCGDCI